MKIDDFIKELMENSELENVIKDDPGATNDNYVSADGGTYYFCLAKHDKSTSGTMNVKGAIIDWLGRHNVECDPDNEEADLYSMVLSALPAWAYIAPDCVIKHVLIHHNQDKDGNKRVWLKKEMKRLLRCLKGKPEWIQQSSWPINENGPMVFIGQIDIDGVYHDDARAYVFVDPLSGDSKTIIQVS